jgi:hypothetical protein
MGEKSATSNKCPGFDGNRDLYIEWKGKMEDWVWMVKGEEKHIGLKVRKALSGEPWELVAGIKREELVKEDGWINITDILDKKYGVDKRREKMINMKKLFRIERSKDESIKDFISRFDLIMRKCSLNGMAALDEEHKGGLLMGRSCLDEQEEKILIGALDGSLKYDKVTKILLEIFGEEKKEEKKKIWLADNQNLRGLNTMKCYVCQKTGHISRACPDKKECQGCGKRGHSSAECRHKDSKCYRCGGKGHLSYQCKKEKGEKTADKEGERVLFGDMDNEETDWETIYGIIDTGCKNTIVGSI